LCATRVHRIFRPTFSDDRETPLLRAEDARKDARDLPVATSKRACDTVTRRANQVTRQKTLSSLKARAGPVGDGGERR
jgi:hypothetical protein